MRRREFIAALGSAAAWPVVARAQQTPVPVVGYLSPGSPETFGMHLAVFRRALAEAGYVEGQSVALEYRWAGDRYERLPELAADLVAQRVAVLCVVANASAVAARRATSSIPIVFTSGGDPVELGLVDSLNRPGGNATGITMFLNELSAKRLEKLCELVPSISRVAFMVNPTNPRARINASDLQAAARLAGLEIVLFNTSHERDFEEAFETLVQRRADALLVDGDVLFNDGRERLVELAVRHRVPASYQARESVIAGGLMSYGPSIVDAYRQMAIYVGRILKGTKPADLPLLRPTKFDLLINLKTAKTLGLTIPETLLAIADEVIQ
jgi:putative ABC transport system substrate-binding protein